jgi:hypothetical protein
MAAPRMLCPSARCTSGAILLGIVMPDGRVAFPQERLVIDETFVETAHQGRPPEQRFRFSSPCVESGCCQWTGSRCGIIDEVLEVHAPTHDKALPACSIRSTCRWFAQAGPAACRVCPDIVTDQRAAASEPAL